MSLVSKYEFQYNIEIGHFEFQPKFIRLSTCDIYKLMDTEGYAEIPQLWFNLRG